MSKTRLTVLLLVAAALAACPSCVKKSIGIRSDPPGALVYIDGVEVGRTPVDCVPFEFYGTREFALYKKGYLCERRVIEMDTPWYSCFPIDIVSELILPWDIRDSRHYYFELRRTEPIEDAALMQHAHETRETAKTRIEAARRLAEYRPRASVVKDAEKKSIFWGPFTSPPRTEPAYQDEEPEAKK